MGYKSVIIPIFAIAISIFVSFSLAAMYGIAVAALGMLSTIATGLAIDAYGPISDNAGGIAEMAGMSHKIRERTDALDAAGNTTAAIGKVCMLIGFFFFVSQRLLFFLLIFCFLILSFVLISLVFFLYMLMLMCYKVITINFLLALKFCNIAGRFSLDNIVG